MFHNLGSVVPFAQIPLMIGGAIIGWVLLMFIFAAILQWLWNMTIPEVFGLKSLTYWQAFRLMIIAAILFGGGGGVNVNG